MNLCGYFHLQNKVTKMQAIYEMHAAGMKYEAIYEMHAAGMKYKAIYPI